MHRYPHPISATPRLCTWTAVVLSALLLPSACGEDRRHQVGPSDGPCANVTCPGTPGSCEGDVAVLGQPDGECDPETGQCTYVDLAVPTRDCAAEGLPCRDGECVESVDLCAGVDCGGTAGRCEGEVAHSGTGSECDPATGECQEAPGRPPRDCAAESLVCANGECVEPQDLCADVDCAGSPARCDGEVAYSGTAAECNPAIGECQEAPGEPPRDCAAESLVCVNGNCVGQDLCANVDCTQRPARCEGDVAQGATHSECDPSSGECLLAPGVPPRDCAAEGLVCRDGDCVAPADDGLVSCELVELPGDLFTVFRAPSIAGQVLTVPVQYSGGCEEHIFPGCFDDFLEGGDNLRVALRIGHDGNGDLCKATPTEELEFDLGPVIEAWSAIPDHGVSFSLTVTGFRGVLQYP